MLKPFPPQPVWSLNKSFVYFGLAFSALLASLAVVKHCDFTHVSPYKTLIQSQKTHQTEGACHSAMKISTACFKNYYGFNFSGTVSSISA